MKFTIIGSGGCVALPKPLCQCGVCREARAKGVPYSRCGCSLYSEELKLLVDTPEDIVHAINQADLKEIDRVLFSHMDPDHTLGMRVFEHLRLNWFEVSEGRECASPIDVFAMGHVMDDMGQICTKHGPILDYYEKARNLIRRHVVEEAIQIEDVKITFIQAGVATVFLFEKDEEKFIYAPCDVKPFPKNELFQNADMLVIGNTIVGDVLKGGFTLKEGNFLKEDLFSLAEIKQLKEQYKIKKVVITHLEEDWGKSFDDYTQMENELENIFFAYDGMELKIGSKRM